MSTLIQVILINLAVSADNVGVIALATKELPRERALTARRLGIGLSVLLKLGFIAVAGFLFGVSWLHIRIIGGVMLLYVTWNMLRQSRGAAHKREGKGSDSFLFAMVSIVAADISMSLDNVLAILSIVSADGGAPDRRDMLLVVGGLLASVPVLLWFSGAISALMERIPALTYLCAGYLVYIAVRMIFEDETIALFFQSVNFTFTGQAAALLGGLVVLASLYTGSASSTEAARRRRAVVPVYFVIAVYSLITVGVFSFLSTQPLVEGRVMEIRDLYGFAPNGADAVYTIGSSPFLFTLCASILVGITMEPAAKGEEGYLKRMGHCMLGMAVFILLELAITTVGLTVKFGFGRMEPRLWLTNLALQVLLHCAYVSVFCMIRMFVRSRAATVAVSMLLLLLETIVVDISIFHRSWLFVAGFLPDYYVITLPEQIVSIHLILRVMLIAALCIVGSTYVGLERRCKVLERGGFPGP